MQRHYSIDYIRAFCILYLMGFWHLAEYTGIPHDDYNTLITRRVVTVVLGLMVLISGFLCGRSRIDGVKDLLTYYWGRFWRLYPPFLAASGLFYIFKIDRPERLLHSIELVGMFTKDFARTLWFVNLLVLFYFAAPLFLWTRKRLWLCLGMLGLALGGVITYDQLTHHLDLRVIIYLPCFVTGILLAQKTPKLTWSLTAVLTVLLGGAIWLTQSISYEDLRDSPLQMPMAVVASLLIFLLAFRFLDRLKTPKLIAVVSYASYFMYLFHRPLYRHAEPLVKGFDVPVRTALLVCVAVPLLIVLAYGLQKAYDVLIKGLVPKKSVAEA